MSKDIDFFRQPAAEREWQMQERALHASREGAADSGDPRERAYRLVDSALHAADEIALPADFAEQLAARAGRLRSPAPPADQRFESLLLRLLIGGLLLAGLVVAVLQGSDWFRLDTSSWALAANPWLLALGVCLAVSQGAEVIRRRML